MDILKKYFPFAFKSTDKEPFIISLLIHIVGAIVGGFIIGLLVKIPVIGIIFTLIGSLISLYALAGIVLSILVFLKVLE